MLQPLEKYLNEFLDEAVPRVGTSGIDCVIYQNHCQVYGMPQAIWMLKIRFLWHPMPYITFIQQQKS